MPPEIADPTVPAPAVEHRAPRLGRWGAVFVGLGVAALAAAGLLLWAAQGPAVFNEVVIAALAWCF